MFCGYHFQRSLLSHSLSGTYNVMKRTSFIYFLTLFSLYVNRFPPPPYKIYLDNFYIQHFRWCHTKRNRFFTSPQTLKYQVFRWFWLYFARTLISIHRKKEETLSSPLFLYFSTLSLRTLLILLFRYRVGLGFDRWANNAASSSRAAVATVSGASVSSTSTVFSSSSSIATSSA